METIDKNETPPYVPYATFTDALKKLKEKSLPSYIDTLVFPGFSRSSIAALVPAFRFLDLISESGQPTESLQKLHKALPNEQQIILGEILKKKFPKAVSEIAVGTTVSFEKNFDYTLGESVKRKCLAFFSAAAKDSGLPISQHIGVRVRKKYKPRAGEKNNKGKVETNIKENGSTTSPEKPLSEDFVRLPIIVGMRIWSIDIPKSHDNDEIIKFTEMIKLALLK